MFFAFRDIPTLPVWGATISCSVQKLIGCISIHAPRVGSDSKLAQYITDCYVQDANILAYITMI